MTTLAFDGRYLAADTLAHRSGTRSMSLRPKIDMFNGVAYAATGCYGGMLREMIAWHQNGADPAALPPHGFADVRELGNIIMVELATRRVFVFSHLLPYADEECAPFACGSGGDQARGAMRCDRTAMEAVANAAIDDIHTNDTIDFIDLEWPDKGVQRWDGLMPSMAHPMPINQADCDWAVGHRGKHINPCGDCPGCRWAVDKHPVTFDTADLKAQGVLKPPTHVGREPGTVYTFDAAGNMHMTPPRREPFARFEQHDIGVPGSIGYAEATARGYIEARSNALTKTSCWERLIDGIGEKLAKHPDRSKIMWRNRPEVSDSYDHAECQTTYTGYARFVMLPPDDESNAKSLMMTLGDGSETIRAFADTDEDGNPRLCAHEATHCMQVVGASNICEHGYVYRTCETCGRHAKREQLVAELMHHG